MEFIGPNSLMKHSAEFKIGLNFWSILVGIIIVNIPIWFTFHESLNWISLNSGSLIFQIFSHFLFTYFILFNCVRITGQPDRIIFHYPFRFVFRKLEVIYGELDHIHTRTHGLHSIDFFYRDQKVAAIANNGTSFFSLNPYLLSRVEKFIQSKIEVK